MKYFHAQRLMKLARFLYALPEEKFDFSVIVAGPDQPRKELDCGSRACAIGWCPVVFPKLAAYRKNEGGVFSYQILPIVEGKKVRDDLFTFGGVPHHLFGLEDSEGNGLFEPRHQHLIKAPSLSQTASAKEVARHIARFVKTKFPNIDITLA